MLFLNPHQKLILPHDFLKLCHVLVRLTAIFQGFCIKLRYVPPTINANINFYKFLYYFLMNCLVSAYRIIINSFLTQIIIYQKVQHSIVYVHIPFTGLQVFTTVVIMKPSLVTFLDAPFDYISQIWIFHCSCYSFFIIYLLIYCK